MVSNIKDGIKNAIIGKVKDQILEEVTKMNDKDREEVKRAVKNLGGKIDHLDNIVNNKIKAT